MSNKAEQELAGVFAALGDATRLALVTRLLAAGALSATALVEGQAISRQAIVKHLQVLEACGLIRSEKIGRVRTCRIEPGGLGPLADWIAERRIPAERHLDRLGQILAEADPPKAQDQEKDEKQ